jgi:5-methylcytosine-specific restriction enzyme subunit McrC
MSPLIQVFEHDNLTGLKPEVLDKLYKFNDDNGNKYFTGTRNGVKFTEYVGVIQIGGQTIEILPKADKNGNADKNEWRDALLGMLAKCRKINLETVSDANLSKRHCSLLELYFDRYLSELERLLHKGLIKKYRSEIGNVTALKGQLQFAQQIQKNLVHKERFYTRHQTYDTEHLINQILLKALSILSGMVSNPFLISKIQRLKLNFPEIKEIAITQTHFQRVKLDRKSIDYHEALQIAKMVILNYSPDLKSGNENMIALLFNMNKLWEEYIYRMLQSVPDNEYHIESQDSQKFWQSKTIRPDIVLTHNTTKEVFIIDTKWKVLSNTEPSDDDLKQMFAYNLNWKSYRSVLLYPKTEHNTSAEPWGEFHKGMTEKHYCKLGFVDVLMDGKLNMEIGGEVLGKLRVAVSV